MCKKAFIRAALLLFLLLQTDNLTHVEAVMTLLAEYQLSVLCMTVLQGSTTCCTDIDTYH